MEKMELDLFQLNEEFCELLGKHYGKDYVEGIDDEEFEELKDSIMEDDTFTEHEKRQMILFHAMPYNAFNELCQRHKEIVGKLHWFCGAEFTRFRNVTDDYYVSYDDEIESKVN